MVPLFSFARLKRPSSRARVRHAVPRGPRRCWDLAKQRATHRCCAPSQPRQPALYRRKKIAANRLASQKESARKDLHPSRIYVIKHIRLGRKGGVSDAERNSRKGEFH